MKVAKIAVGAIAVLVLLLSFFGTLFVSVHDLPRWMCLILILALIASLAVGLYWSICLHRMSVSDLRGAVLNGATRSPLSHQMGWLQVLRPKLDAVGFDLLSEGAVRSSIKQQHRSTVLLGLALLAAGVLLSIGASPTEGRALFGQLSRTEIGRAFIVAFFVYAFLSSASLYFAGVFLVNKERN